MKLQYTPIGHLTAVAGVFGTGPVIKGEPVEINHRRKGGQELLQAGRPIALSDSQPQLLSFAAINGLKVRNYTEVMLQQPKISSPKVYCIDL